jgi:hypothetical protein
LRNNTSIAVRHLIHEKFKIQFSAPDLIAAKNKLENLKKGKVLPGGILGSSSTFTSRRKRLEEEKVLFSGDLVEYEAGVYTGDAQLQEWPATLEALRALNAEAIVPGRGEAMKGQANVNKALDYTKRWVETLFNAGKEAVAGKMDLKAAMAHTRKSMDPVFGHVFIYEHCLPFDVTRAYDEASGIKNPRIWTAERDIEMWKALQD